jgi:hypothetical protein
MWASKAVKFGYKWHVGNGKSIKFWEDIWFGNSPLATQFWDLYFVSNQQNKTIFDIWDGHEIRGTFRRTFTEDMMAQWYELLEIAKTISFSQDDDLESILLALYMLLSILGVLNPFICLLFGN